MGRDCCDPLVDEMSKSMKAWVDITNQTAVLQRDEHPYVIATVVAYKSPQSARPGSKAIILPDGTISGWIGGGCVQPIVIREALKALQTGEPKLVSITLDDSRSGWKGVESHHMTCHGGGSLEVYIEPVLPKPELVIVGNSPIAEILMGLGRLLDYKVCVADPDATQERFPEADLVLTDLRSARARITSATYVVIATMGTGDEEGLEAVADTAPKYLGLIASAQKAKGLFQYLQEKGIPAEDLSRVKCPAGLSLGAESLPEIALSVMGEIVQLRRSSTEAVQISRGKSKLPVMNGAPAPAVSESSALSRDPVCGMMVDVAGARYAATVEDSTFYFCCVRCKESFEKSPESYLTESAGGI